MTDLEQRVLDETRRFEAMLPELLARIPGRWVVFRDGRVWSEHADGASAYRAAVERFGEDGAFVVAPVREARPIPMTAAIGFFMP
jgi:hypothetical protein